MRYFLISTALLFASPALADQFQTDAPVTDVTVYPWGAGVTRTASLDLPAGAHEVIVTGIPPEARPDSLRITGDGATLGAVRFQEARALPRGPEESAEFRAARDEVDRLETALAEHEARVAEITARAEAAGDTIAFLMKIADSDAAGSGDIAGLTGPVAAQLLEARQTMVRAQAEAKAADRDRRDIEKDLTLARNRLEALRAPDIQGNALVIAVQGQGAPATLRITTQSQRAGWEPVYDLSLQRKEGALRMERGLMVRQDSGEDWQNVRLRLSTARPMDQSAPSELSPQFLRIEDPASKIYSRSFDTAEADMIRAIDEAYPAPVMAVEPVVVAGSAVLESVGETVVYDYPTPVTIRAGADALRLPLDAHDLTPEVLAEAIPSRDDTAYLVADTVNTTGAIILPGNATFYADGAMVGQGMLDLVAAGDDMKLGFGPLTGIKLERRIPDENEGDRGLIVKSAERSETALLKIRNLTAEEWPLRIIDQVPVATQEDLRIEWSANPAPDETDPDGKRGLLVWNGQIAPGEERNIEIRTQIRWPDGQTLIGR